MIITIDLHISAVIRHYCIVLLFIIQPPVQYTATRERRNYRTQHYLVNFVDTSKMPVLYNGKCKDKKIEKKLRKIYIM